MAGIDPDLGNRVIAGLLKSMDLEGELVAYTGHGHHIPGTPLTGTPPAQKSRCGGPSLCNECLHDAARARAAMEAQEVEGYEELHKYVEMKVPLVYYRGMDRIVIGEATLKSGGVVDAVIGSTESEAFGNVLHPDALHVSVGFQPPRRWMDDLRINSFVIKEEKGE